MTQYMQTSNVVRSRFLVALAMAWFSLTSQFAAAANDSGTLADGSDSVLCRPPASGSLHRLGFETGFFGSYSPTGLTGGKTVSDLFDQDADGTCGATFAAISISGFSVDPGTGWLTSVTCNAVSRLESNVLAYTYSSGTASWSWSAAFGFVSGSEYTCTIDHSRFFSMYSRRQIWRT